MTRAPWPAAALALAGLAAAVQTPPTQRSADAEQNASPGAASPLVEFATALRALRAGDLTARAALDGAARRSAAELGREDALLVARYYLELPATAHAPSLEAESRLDDLRDRAARHDEDEDPAGSDARSALLEDLRSLGDVTEALEDRVPHAHLLSLLSRLEVRALEEDPSNALLDASTLAGIRRRAQDALARFDAAGMSTPRLEPLWTLARLALLEGDLTAAERALLELEQRAVRAARPAWVERALVGLVGVHRARGAPHAAGRALARLARERDPRACWSLAREVAVQRLSKDDASGARRWLLDHPPSLDDDEIELETAEAEWDALLVATDLREGRADPAAARREDTPRLLRAALLLELGDPGAALDALAEVPPSERGTIDQAALTGRALVTAGRAEEAIAPLTKALVRAARRPAAAPGTVKDASAVGEWLGLSSVVDLAVCHIEARDDAVGAAAVIEASHADGDVEAARARVLEAAASTEHGLVTWLTGADRTLRVVITPDGAATATVLPHGRAAMERAVQRARSAVTDATDDEELAQELAPLAAALLPPAAGSGADGGTLLLLPHGPLERAPLEALPVADGAALGLRRALRIATALPRESDRAPRVDLRRARWSGFGAPSATSAPDLGGARRELESLDALSPRFDAVVAEAFTEDALADALAGDAPLHVATHVTRSTDSLELVPLGLLTSGDRVLGGARIAAIAPRLPMLALIACGSAEGAAFDGLGVRGLAQLAIDAGTREALVTQWPVEDTAAARASLVFHGALRAGEDPAEAARRARALLAGIGAPPREWAAYRLLGAP